MIEIKNKKKMCGNQSEWQKSYTSQTIRRLTSFIRNIHPT